MTVALASRPGVHTSSHMVRWKDDEIQKVAQRVIVLSRADNKDPMKHYGYGRTVFEAQNVLPAERHRGIESVTGEKNQKFIKQAIQKIILREADETIAAAASKAVIDTASKAAADSPKTNSLSHLTHAVPPQTQHISTADVGKGLSTPSTPFEPRQVEEELDLGEFSGMGLEEMFQTAAKKMAHTLASAFVSEIRKQFAGEIPMLAARANSINKKLPKILVVGPLSKQQPALEAAVDGVIELKFVSSEERPNIIDTRGKYCVGCVIWTQFVNHSHLAAAQRLFPGNSLRSVNGTNLEALRNTLEDLALHYNA